MIMEDTPTTSMENAADQRKRYEEHREAVWNALGAAGRYAERGSLAELQLIYAGAQVHATLAQAAATMAVADEVKALRRAGAIGLPIGDSNTWEQHLDAITEVLRNVGAEPADRCTTVSPSGWRCPEPAQPQHMHTVDYDEDPDPVLYQQATGRPYVRGEVPL